MIRLYALAGSIHTKEAQGLLSRKRIAFEHIDVEALGMLADLDVALGIRALPAVEDERGRRYEGLGQIRDYVENGALPKTVQLSLEHTST